MTPRIVLLALLVILAGCGSDDLPPDNAETIDLTPAAVDAPNSQTVLGALDAHGLTSFKNSVENAGLDQTLAGEGPFTVLAPVNDVLDLETFNPSDHILQGRFETVFLAGTIEVESISGHVVTFVEEAGRVTLLSGSTSANIVQSDIQLDNGVIHIIDQAFSPQP